MNSSRKLYEVEAVRDWETRFAPLITEMERSAVLRSRRKGKAGRSWYTDETYLKVNGKWCYLYRAIDRDGNLVDSMLSEKRDMNAAKRFFKGAKEVTGRVPERVTTDGHESYPRAIRKILGRKVIHRTNRLALIKLPYYRMEQDHQGMGVPRESGREKARSTFSVNRILLWRSHNEWSELD